MNVRLINKIAEILGLDERELKKRLDYINITEEDIANLREISKRAEGRDLREIFSEFYDHLLKFPETREILESDGGLIDRLKNFQSAYLRELIAANYNSDYILKRLKVGMVHEERGVEPKYFTGAFSKWLEITLPLIYDRTDPEGSFKRAISFFKAVLFDITLSLDAYYFSKILKARDIRYSAIFENAFDPIIVADLQTLKIIEANRRALELLSVKKDELVGISLLNIHPDESRDSARFIYERIRSSNYIDEKLQVIDMKTGSRIPCEVGLSRYRIDEKEFVVGIFRDLREKIESEDKLRKINSLYEALSGINTLVTAVRDKESLFTESVRIVKEKGGFKFAGVYSTGSENPIASKGNFSHEDTSVCLKVNGTGRDFYFIVVSRKEREGFTKEEVGLLSEIAQDISFGLRWISSEEEMTHLKFYDDLTTLPNRTYFNTKLKEMIGMAEGRKEEIGLLVFDIDHFGEMNEALGHNYGDLILKAVSVRIREVVRSSDFLGRIGADEFAVIIQSSKARLSVEKLVDRLMEAFSQPLIINSSEIYITFSFGASYYPTDAEGPEKLLTNAVASLERAKNLGGNRIVHFSSDISIASEDRLRLRTELRKAFEKEEFALFFQPKIDLKTGNVSGAEALLRWIRKGKIVSPDLFIPLLEEGELIHQIGEWVVRKASESIRFLKDKGLEIPVAVNISPIQLKIPALADRILYWISSEGGNFESIEVEITESALMEDTSVSVEFLNALASYGIKTYIDDFGTGYSSLSYIKKLPVYALKIDREFVKDLPYDKDDLEIVKATILLAKTFGLKTVAEGVETREQAELLKDLECDYAQGFYFAKPMPFEEFKSYLEVSLKES